MEPIKLDVDQKLDILLHKFDFMSDAYEVLHNQIVCGLKGNLGHRNLEEILLDFKNEIRSMISMIKSLEEGASIGTLQFMAKRLDNLCKDVEDIKKAEKKKIDLQFTIDGYEYVKKKKEGAKDPNFALEELLKTLTEREGRVLRLRYGIGGKKRTLRQAGVELEINSERVRQIEAKALRKCRHPKRRGLVESIMHIELKKDILGENKEEDDVYGR